MTTPEDTEALDRRLAAMRGRLWFAGWVAIVLFGAAILLALSGLKL